MDFEQRVSEKNLNQEDIGKDGHTRYRIPAARSRKRLSTSSPMRDWEIIETGLASNNWDSAYNSEGGHFGVNAA